MPLTTEGQRRLIWHGMFLFLLGLLVGFAEGQVTNPRMGLAAHLEGLMNGTFLIALGAVWPFVRLSMRLALLWQISPFSEPVRIPESIFK